MREEKEQKYLVRSDAWRLHAGEGMPIRQGYLSTDPDRSVRIRVTPNEAFVTIKGGNGLSPGHGLNRAEFEYDIPISDAAALLDSVCRKPIIEKTRYSVKVDGFEWEIDEFRGENRGLVLAEVEADSDAGPTKPEWIGDEVSSDSRFQNANLIDNPFSKWGGQRNEEEPEFHFKRGESIREACLRILLSEIDSALRQLADPSAASNEEAIHEARKSVKKIRATLRLIQPALGKSYRAANEQLRDVGRTLSSLRDAHALSESLDALTQHSRLREVVIQDLHQVLDDLAKQRQQEAQDPEAWNAMRSKLQFVEKEANDWSIPDHSDFSGIADGLRRRFRRGRKAFEQACDHPQSEQLHEWRKRVKDHWYHMRLLRKSWPEVFDGYIAALDQLETALGDDHNLVLLEQFLANQSGASGSEEALEALRTAIRDRREELLGAARESGRRIYSERAGVMLKRTARAWKAWHRDKDEDSCPTELAARTEAK